MNQELLDVFLEAQKMEEKQPQETSRIEQLINFKVPLIQRVEEPKPVEIAKLKHEEEERVAEPEIVEIKERPK